MDRFGPNAVRTHRVNAAEVLKRQLNNAVLALLAATAVISFFLWMWRKTQLTCSPGKESGSAGVRRYSPPRS
ncbi:hypothetical protein FPV58_22265 [Mycolicibacterium porcinum]|uniref:hypothetical protein n=1 Tax=Mycolicibacterium porcinum TaxID=39693 RepID=UPI001195D5A0|nr:hypothetical protein FPV58_22265 [Mycolicibacterium porcinum]